jgi:thiol-disulfide isomerase/thioredoxin
MLYSSNLLHERKLMTRHHFSAALVASLVSIALMTARLAASAEIPDPRSLQGKDAPAFSLKTLDGKDVKLADLKGSVVVVDFWATWCPPCRASLPHIQKLADDKELAAKGLKVLVVNVREDKPTIQPFMQKNHYTFTVPLDSDGNILQHYLVTGIPTTFVIGKDGKVKAAFVGYDESEGGKDVDQAVEAALKEKA